MNPLLELPDLANVFIAAIIMVGCFLLIWLFFRHIPRSAPKFLKRLIQVELAAKRNAELLPGLEELRKHERSLEDDQWQLQLDIEGIEDKDRRAELIHQQQQKQQELHDIQQQISSKQEKYRQEANQYAKSFIDDLDVNDVLVTDERSRSIVIEYVTVTIVIASILVLAVMGILTGEQVAPILASIVGYVLGRTTGERATT